MPSLFIGATDEMAGQSLMAWAIARRLKGQGFKVGFMKPFGNRPASSEAPWIDPDVQLFKEELGLTDPVEKLCPYSTRKKSWGEQEGKDILAGIEALARELSIGKDVLLVLGPENIFHGEPSHVLPDLALIRALNADCVLVDRYQEPSKSSYSIFSVLSLLKNKLKGIIINRVPMESLDEVEGRFVQRLSAKGVPSVAVVPEDPALSYCSLRDIRDVLEGKVLCGENSLDQPVGGMTVGAGELEGALQILKRAFNKIILLKPTVSPMVPDEKTVMRSIAGILLTAGRLPADRVLHVVCDSGIPLIAIEDETFAAIDKLGKAPPRLHLGDDKKVQRFTELLDKDGALDNLIRAITAR